MRQGVLVALIAAVVTVSSLPGHAGSPSKPCSDIPLRVTIYNNAVTDPSTGTTIPSAIQSDGGGEYINGTSASALVKLCDGTNDAVLNVTSSRRTFTYAFPSPLAGSIVETQPTWVPGQYALSGWINVRNITYSKVQFTTHMGSTFTGPDRATYRLGWDPFVVDAPDLHSGDTSAQLDNSPFSTSPAVVYPTYPAVCGVGSMPTWLVRGTTPNDQGTMEVATLHKMITGPHSTQTHDGQYTLPFEIFIEAMQCFAY